MGVDGGHAGVEAALARLYRERGPDFRWVTDKRWDEGGRDPLDAVLVYARRVPVPHWHFIGVGLTHGGGSPGDEPRQVPPEVGEDGRGWTFELTARLARSDQGHEHPPIFMANLLQNLARYVAESGSAFGPGHTMDLYGPIQEGADTPIGHALFVNDPELGRPNAAESASTGDIDFLQVVGLTADEAIAKKSWSIAGFVELFSETYPMMVTRLDRRSILSEPGVSARLEAGRRRDGSSTAGMVVESLNVGPAARAFPGRLRRPVATIDLDAATVEALCLLLPLRIPFEQPFEIEGPDVALTFTSDEHVELHEHEPSHWLLGLSSAQAHALGGTLAPRAGTYTVEEIAGVRFRVHSSQVRDQNDEVIDTTG